MHTICYPLDPVHEWQGSTIRTALIRYYFYGGLSQNSNDTEMVDACRSLLEVLEYCVHLLATLLDTTFDPLSIGVPILHLIPVSQPASDTKVFKALFTFGLFYHSSWL